MSTVRDIERAIRELPEEGLRKLRKWFAELDAAVWDAELSEDASSGVLESLADEALRERREGRTGARTSMQPLTPPRSPNRMAWPRHVLTALAMIAVASCARSSDFVFYNATSAPVELSYTFIDANPDSRLPQLSDQPKGPWQPVASSAYVVSSDRRSITVQVPPHSALKLFSISNYPGNDLRGLHVFPLSALAVANRETNTSVALQNERALLAFQRWSDQLYVLPAYELKRR